MLAFSFFYTSKIDTGADFARDQWLNHVLWVAFKELNSKIILKDEEFCCFYNMKTSQNDTFW